jgi:hypothetical protein
MADAQSGQPERIGGNVAFGSVLRFTVDVGLEYVRVGVGHDVRPGGYYVSPAQARAAARLLVDAADTMEGLPSPIAMEAEARVASGAFSDADVATLLGELRRVRGDDVRHMIAPPPEPVDKHAETLKRRREAHAARRKDGLKWSRIPTPAPRGAESYWKGAYYQDSTGRFRIHASHREFQVHVAIWHLVDLQRVDDDRQGNIATLDTLREAKATAQDYVDSGFVY